MSQSPVSALCTPEPVTLHGVFHPHRRARPPRPIRFVSIGLSRLSRLRDDLRLPLPANRAEFHRGIKCFLWSGIWRSVSLHLPARPVERASFDLYERLLP